MLKAIRIVFLLGLLITTFIATQARAATSRIDVLNVNGTIVPIIADYIDRGITRAENENAAACIIELDTPGGLLDSTEKIVQKIMNANVPVVVYVTPKGAWAASAGTFITLSAHIAAMTPGTTIGAAHPVSGSGETIPPDEMQKITEFSAKWMKTIAEERGRNIEEAQLAVNESKSFSDIDALNANLINLRADSLASLISQINGMKVKLANGAEVTINTTGYEVVKNPMTSIESFLQAISNPNIAYILLSLGGLGIMAEIYNPGALFPGIAGAISLLLAFYSLGVLEANLGGLLLVLLGFGLFIAELFSHSFGALTAGGLASLVLGSLILFKGGASSMRVDPWLIATIAIIIVGFLAFAITRIVRTYRRQPFFGREELVGKTATVRATLDPEGIVFFKGERWIAISESGRIEPGEEVIIKKVENLKLHVAKK